MTIKEDVTINTKKTKTIVTDDVVRRLTAAVTLVQGVFCCLSLLREVGLLVQLNAKCQELCKLSHYCLPM